MAGQYSKVRTFIDLFPTLFGGEVVSKHHFHMVIARRAGDKHKSLFLKLLDCLDRASPRLAQRLDGDPRPTACVPGYLAKNSVLILDLEVGLINHARSDSAGQTQVATGDGGLTRQV